MLKPQIFIINLQRSSERRIFMQEQIKRWDTLLDFTFFAAIDAKNGEHLAFSKHFSNIFGRMFKGRILSDSEKACYASHFSLWEKCIELDKAIFVLEDDAMLDDDFYVAASKIANSKYNFVRLAALVDKKKYPLGDNFMLCFEKVGLALAYYITPSAAKQLVKSASLWFCPVDDLMDISYYTKIPNILYYPFAIKSSDDVSTIGQSRTKNSGIFWKAAREIIRILRFIYKQSYLLLNKKSLLRKMLYSKNL